MDKNLAGKRVKVSDVGVLILAYNRPEMLHKRIKELSNSKICNLFISIDGGRSSHSPEMESTKDFARLAFKQTKNFNLNHHKKNLGMVKHITREISNVLAEYKYVIVVEDDVKIVDNFIENMISGINLQNRLGLNGIVSGWSPLYAKKLSNRWRVTTYPFIWGWACSRKTWNSYTYDLSKIDIEKELLCSESWDKLSNYQKTKWLGYLKKTQLNPKYTWDAQLFFLLLKNNHSNLSPIFSITGNEGFNDIRAVHTKGRKPRAIKNKKINESTIFKLNRFSKLIEIVDKIYMNDYKILNQLIRRVLFTKF